MLDPSRTVAARRLLITVAVVSALWLFVQPTRVRAQAGRSTLERDASVRKADEEREMEIRRLELMKDARPDKSSTARLAFKQNAEDFRQMQIVNNEMMRATFAGGAARALDYDHISKATAEINRRAARLRTNLQLPTPEQDEKRAAEPEIAGAREMRSSLLSLNELITFFVNNPTFRNQGVLDAQQAASASRDLSAIIRLSQQIKQRAKKLKD